MNLLHYVFKMNIYMLFNELDKLIISVTFFLIFLTMLSRSEDGTTL